MFANTKLKTSEATREGCFLATVSPRFNAECYYSNNLFNTQSLIKGIR